MINNYVSLDLEMTGLNPKLDKIIEIGAIRVVNGQITEQFETLVNPGRQISGEIEELTGITNEMLRTAVKFQEVCNDFYSFLGADVLLGHGLLYDYSFIKKAAINNDIPYEAYGIDTLKLSRTFLPALESHKLSELCSYYQIKHQPHRAFSDAKMTHELYQRLLSDFYNEESDRYFEPQKMIYQVKKEQPATKHQLEKLKELLSCHSLQSEYELETMTRNEASRYMDKIILKHGRMEKR